MTKIGTLAAAALAAGGVGAAPVVQWDTGFADDYATRIEFESTGQLAQGALVTTQFAADGVTLAGAARANGCGWHGPQGSMGWTGNYIVTYDGSCAINDVAETLTMDLGSDQTRAAFKARVSDYYQTTVLELLNDGVVVYSLNLMRAQFNLPGAQTEGYDDGLFYSRRYAQERWGVVRIDGNGAAFDQIRFREGATGATGGAFFMFDDLRYGTAAAVPEPGSLALAALALGLGWRRRHRR